LLQLAILIIIKGETVSKVQQLFISRVSIFKGMSLLMIEEEEEESLFYQNSLC
jgi:hypothetical protein